MPAGNGDPSTNDLTPTQWLFGRNAFSKLARMPATGAQVAGRGGWTSAFAVAEHINEKQSDSDVAARRAVTGAVLNAGPERIDSAAATERFLVQEWRRIELNVADSVYHENLAHLASSFDSAQRARLSDDERTRALQRIDAALAANSYTWLKFRGEVARRADSAVAALAKTAGGT